MTFAIGIDVGTSGVRALAMDRDGRVTASAGAPMPPPEMRDGSILQDPAVWLAALAEALKRLSSAADLKRAVTLAIDGTSGTILPVDAAGRPLALASMYNDPGAKERAKSLAAHAPPETAALGATSPLARAIIRQSLAGVAKVLHQADWLAGQFTGTFDVTDENNALKTGYDPVARNWPRWLADAGLDMPLLPEVHPAGQKIGTVTAAAAARFGLSAGITVAAGTTDGCAAFLATGAGAAGDAVTSLGTTLTVKLLSATPVFAPAFGIYSHRIGETWLAGGASNTGGAALLKHFSADRMIELEPRLDPSRPTGLDYYPLPQAGERFPVNDPSLPPRDTPRPDDDAVFFQGLLESISRIESEGYRKLSNLGASPLATMRTVGGGAKNAAWTSIRQAALGVPFHGSLSLEAAAGAARLAWRGAGVSL